ncbi:MAG: UDP-N-acetylmuramate dehydrogenase [Bacillota bacterium]
MGKGVMAEKELRKIFPGENDLLINEPLRKWTTWKVGGPAEYLVFPNNVSQVIELVKVSQKNCIPLTVLGNGSNVLVKDNGIDGIVVNTSKLNKVEVKDTKIEAEAGISLPMLAKYALQNSLSGLEFAVGIPASLGGAILMNAGAWGKSIGELIEEVTIVDKGNIRKLTKHDIEFKYRDSSLRYHGGIIVAGTLKLVNGDTAKIRNLMDLHKKNRLEKQPLRMPNAGSVFKNPKGYAAGFLIESVGLKGLKIGEAKISDKHANFIVNCGNAKAEDILNLMEEAVRSVESHYGIHLEPEVNILGK